ncbi:Predicted aminoglycoside phosphotransferase [Alteromonadaceae bacterium Bs31]|nr:Predicted aminoglycoside phosphotransferase [Alteromonadaceae bacterium Bs31]
MRKMISTYEGFVTSLVNGGSIDSCEQIQSLWSGYGEILRIHLRGGDHSSVILKHIRLPQAAEHPRGWNSTLSHQRKVKSYQVETHWYQHYASLCTQGCPVPKCLGVSASFNESNKDSIKESNSETFMLLTDLSAAGFSQVKTSIPLQEVRACLSWLAHFHATFLQHSSEGLWDCGTYWHLDTRPDELAALDDQRLKQAAPWIDQALKQSHYQTLVHGDAKLANFCFAPANSTVSASPVAAVDFQYVGAGCGMKDVAYFMGSCLSDAECEQLEVPLLEYYFQVLRSAVNKLHPQVDAAHLEHEWRSLFDVAWADFHRFLKGWSPGHWKINSYSEQLTQRVIQRLGSAL